MAEKTIKTDEVVHEELEALKQEYRVETFNDVLRLELGIDAGTDIDKLSAFLDDELQVAVEKVIDDINEVAQFEQRYEKEYSKDILTFHIPGEYQKIAEVRFSDGRFVVQYRDNRGEMQKCGEMQEDDEQGARYGTTSGPFDHTSFSDVRNSVREKVKKSHRRWS